MFCKHWLCLERTFDDRCILLLANVHLCLWFLLDDWATDGRKFFRDFKCWLAAERRQLSNFHCVPFAIKHSSFFMVVVHEPLGNLKNLLDSWMPVSIGCPLDQTFVYVVLTSTSTQVLYRELRVRRRISKALKNDPVISINLLSLQLFVNKVKRPSRRMASLTLNCLNTVHVAQSRVGQTVEEINWVLERAILLWRLPRRLNLGP